MFSKAACAFRYIDPNCLRRSGGNVLTPGREGMSLVTKGKDVFVGPHKNGDGWQVKKADNEKASVVTETKKEAVDRGRDLARKEQSELIIQNKDGKIAQKDSHGNDPKKSKG